ncbi:type II toxin-antitoxin system RelE/ParE family toxin [Streptomyces sp. NPDC057245]|uniref:type II toxin-antitoxin system RelE family toxin n=1 Tax=Streptomyces sp. NPDC057245 TaxID=3346065 RepID=UPI00363958AB
MTHEIAFEPRALDAAARFRKDDPSGFAPLLDTVDKLADDFRPTGSVPYASAGLRRLRIGGYRVLYAIDQDVVRIMTAHPGRTA